MLYNGKVLGLVISRLRTEEGLSQEALSGLAGISRSHLAALEGGRKNVRVDTLWRIAEALGRPASELLRLTEEEIPPE